MALILGYQEGGGATMPSDLGLLLETAARQARAIVCADGRGDVTTIAWRTFNALRKLDPEDRERRVAAIDRMLRVGSSEA